MNGLNSETVTATGYAPVGSPPAPAQSNEPVLSRRQRRVLERASQKLARRRAGIEDGQAVMREAVQLYPNRPIDQMTFFFQNFEVPSISGRPRTVASKTCEHYMNEGHRMLKDLAALRVGIRNLTDLTYKHVILVARQSERTKGRGASYLKNSWTVMTRLLEWVGKPARNGQRRLADVLHNPASSKRKHVKTDPDTFTSRGLDVYRVLEHVRQEDPIVHAQMLLQLGFGLRVTETLRIRPAACDMGSYLSVSEGTKGGRPRAVELVKMPRVRRPSDSVDIETPDQRRLLDEIKVMAGRFPRGILTFQGLTLEQSRTRYYTVLRKCGVTKKGLGVTSHALRREFAQKYYEFKVGRPAPVVAGVLDLPALTKEQKAAELAARREVAEVLGHGRVQVTGAYCGTVSTMRRFQLNNLKTWTELIEGDEAVRDVMRLYGAHALEHQTMLTLHLVGDPARGIPPRLDPHVMYFVLQHEPLRGVVGGQDMVRVDEKPTVQEDDAMQSGEPIHTRASEELVLRGVRVKAARDLEPHLERIMGMSCRVVEFDHFKEYTGGVDETLLLCVGEGGQVSGQTDAAIEHAGLATVH